MRKLRSFGAHAMFEQSAIADSTDRSSQICVLLNDTSGKKEAGPTAEEMQSVFERFSLSPRVVHLDPSRSFRDSVSSLTADGHRTIIAAGGDGTISGVAQALLGTSCRFGILPRGTFNYFARSLDIPQDLETAVKVIAQGHVRSLRVAMLNDTVFLNNANFGLYPQVLRSREDIYNFWGRSRAAAYWSALKVLFQWPRPLILTITTNGTSQTYRTPMIFVLNNAFQLRQMGMDGVDCIQNGKLAMLIAPDQGRLGMLRSAAAMLMGRAAKHRDFHLVCSDTFEVSSRRKKLLVACDGERRRMAGPFRLGLSEKTLDIIVPPNAKDGAR